MPLRKSNRCKFQRKAYSINVVLIQCSAHVHVTASVLGTVLGMVNINMKETQPCP